MILQLFKRNRPSENLETPTNSSLRRIQAPEELLGKQSRQALLQEINNLVSIPPNHYNALFSAAIMKYARFVQELPASEAHHHSAPGGMLDHGLEVVVNALALRRGHILPSGEDPEAQSKHADRWTYAVFTGALLHDIGKPAVDHAVTLFDDKRKPQGPWEAFSGPMPATGFYQLQFVRPRRYRLHQIAAPLLVQYVIPQVGVSWLAAEQELFEHWISLIAGDMESAGILGQFIQEADSRSVSQSLGAGETARFPNARTVPLHEKLLTALRHLIEDGQVPLNRNGAAGWLSGEDLWLVSKRVADALRVHLQQEGHTGIPSRNDRIFDVLQEYGILIANGKQAIWRATVSDDGWSHQLTLLRFKKSRIWPNPDSAPGKFTGTVSLLTEDQPAAPIASPSLETTDTGLASVIVPSDTEAINPKQKQTGKPPGIVLAAPEEDATMLSLSMSETSKATQDVDGDKAFEAETQSNTTTNQPSSDDNPLPKSTEAYKDETNDAGKHFLKWLQAGLKSEEIVCNDVRAHVHVVEEGVLLVSPIIFKGFARHTNHTWEDVQKRFQKLGLHTKTSSGENIHHYYTKGNRRKNRISGMLVNDPITLFGERIPPKPNPHLRK